MANKKITDLTALVAADETDVVPIDDVSVPETKKITAANLRTSLLAMPKSAVEVAGQPLTVTAGEGGDDNGGNGPGTGGALTLTAGDAGNADIIGQSDAKLGGKAELHSGRGSTDAGTQVAPSGNASVGVPYTDLGTWGGSGADRAALLLFAGAEPTPTVDGSIVIKSDAEISLEAPNHVKVVGRIEPTQGVLPVVETEAGTARNTGSNDNGKIVRCTAATTVTITALSGFTTGTTTEYVQEGAGQVVIAAGTGVTLLHGAAFNPRTAEQGSSVVISYLSSTLVLVRGDLEGV